MNIIVSAVLLSGVFLFALTVFRDIGLSMIFNLDAFLIVVGGTTIVLIAGFPVQRVRNTVNDIIKAYSRTTDRDAVISDILDISRMYMRTNVRSIEKRIKYIENNYLRLGTKLLISDYGKHDIQNIMERELTLRIVNRNHSQNVLKTVARLTPSLGLAGTVVSLIKMFNHLESVDTIAPMMAVALMSTFYGVIIANLVMLPLCAKLGEEGIEAEEVMHITIEGILAVKNMEHPLKIEERLRGCREDDIAYLPDAGRTLAAPKVPA